MLQRHVPSKRPEAFTEETIGLGTRIALWNCVRRDQRFLSRAAKEIDRLALRLHVRASRARLRADHAEELNLRNLPAADRWWKRQWRKTDNSADVF